MSEVDKVSAMVHAMIQVREKTIKMGREIESLQQENQRLKERLEDANTLIAKCEKELFRFNCDAPLSLTSSGNPVYLEARAYLEKHGIRQ